MSARKWLLDILAEGSVSLDMLSSPLLGHFLNVRNPPGGQSVLPDTVWAAWQDGLLTFHPVVGDAIEPRNREELQTWWRDDFCSAAQRRPSTYLRLTAAGGAWWSAQFEPNWRHVVEADEDDPRTVRPDGLERITLTGIDREVLVAVEARAGGVRVSESPIEDWSPAYWLPPGRAHTVTTLLPDVSVVWQVLREWPWRLPRYFGINTKPPEDMALKRGWIASVIPEGLTCARIFDVRVGAERLHLHLQANGRYGVLEIRGARDVLCAPRHVDETATLLRIGVGPAGHTLDVVWEQRHGRVNASERLELPGTTALWWARGRSTGH